MARYKARFVQRRQPDIPTFKLEEFPKEIQEWINDLYNGGVRAKGLKGESASESYMPMRIRLLSYFEYFRRKELEDKHVFEVDRRDVKRLKRWLLRRVSQNTTRNCLITMHSFYEWAILEEMTEVNPFHYVERPPRVRNKDTVLSREEKRKIYRYLLDRVKKGYKFAVRDLLLYLVMIHTGRRVTEILSLTVKDFDLERKEIIFRKKKGKKNINEPVPAGDLVFKFFNIYLARIARDPTCVGKSGHGNRYKVFDGRLFPFNTRSNVAKMVRRWGYEAGLDRPIYPHLLRATAASDIYDITHDEDVVKKIGGWDSSEWKSYVRRPEERIVKLVREFHRITDNLFSGVKP